MAIGIEFWAFTVDFIGKILIALTALLTHRKLIKEERIDKIVLADMKIEVGTGILGIIMITIGFILHLMRIF